MVSHKLKSQRGIASNCIIPDELKWCTRRHNTASKSKLREILIFVYDFPLRNCPDSEDIAIRVDNRGVDIPLYSDVVLAGKQGIGDLEGEQVAAGCEGRAGGARGRRQAYWARDSLLHWEDYEPEGLLERAIWV